MIRTKINRSILYYESTIVDAWARAGGSLQTDEDITNFRKWLLEIGVPEFEIENLVNRHLTWNEELSDSAKTFLASISEWYFKKIERLYKKQSLFLLYLWKMKGEENV